ncbi:hypothetical protein EVAR_89335_1 [Eumeta japonica]|uniref:Uncharacterized protein n=1 Tax=Eumeta variegata TaxID=151549 RepID=A0A4C1Y4S8_EUMVA|nr:hypothetical protein EVAR_89335_1 [Eumeta japonica]
MNTRDSEEVTSALAGEWADGVGKGLMEGGCGVKEGEWVTRTLTHWTKCDRGKYYFTSVFCQTSSASRGLKNDIFARYNPRNDIIRDEVAIAAHRHLQHQSSRQRLAVPIVYQHVKAKLMQAGAASGDAAMQRRVRGADCTRPSRGSVGFMFK